VKFVCKTYITLIYATIPNLHRSNNWTEKQLTWLNTNGIKLPTEKKRKKNHTTKIKSEPHAAVLMKLHVFEDVTPCRLVVNIVSTQRNSSIFRVEQSSLLGLLHSKDSSTAIIRNVRETRRHGVTFQTQQQHYSLSFPRQILEIQF